MVIRRLPRHPTAAMLSAHPRARLEYWFFKVNAGPVALLVDWIARRRTQENVLRVSIHSPVGRAVLFEPQPLPFPGGAKSLSLDRTCGRLDSVEWELTLDPGSTLIAPQMFPAGLLRIFDMTLLSAPRASFSGRIRHGADRFDLDRAPGLISHYWGRGLPDEWWWVSANQFDTPGTAVECMWLRSGVWGIPASLPLAYLYLRHADRESLWIGPPASVTPSGTPESFAVETRPIAAPPIRLIGRGREFGDLGDGILNTLVGDLEVWRGQERLATAIETAGLERRCFGDSSTA